jgi:serine/threonine-protein kinase PknG
MLNPSVPERKRYCSACNNPLKREAGFCGKCGQRYSFVPSLKPGDLVAGQYQVKGALAYGGLGWIYLGFDNVLSRYVVLKGLLNAHDESSAAVALAERQFLAAVKHPNIVGIYNFVQHQGEGFIVMEYVGGKTLKQIRQERGPLPVAESIAYIHRILPAFAYLHRQGMVYCDFKPDNVMLEKDDVKLIDMGGVRRLDDTKGDIYGTVGYSAPEAGSGPTVESDLFTIGRTLAVLMTQISGFSTEHLYTLPGPEQEPLYAKHESLHRFLLRATAQSPGDRFASADEMADQLLGVLREVVSLETGTPHPGVSQSFSGDVLALESGREMEPVQPNYRFLPMPSLDTADPGMQVVIGANALADMPKRVNALRGAVAQVPKSREAKLRLAVALADTSAFDEASKLLETLGQDDPWDWRVLWVQGRLLLAQNRALEAMAKFDQVYFDLPGETAPKLALGLAAELAGTLDLAVKMYDLVTRTDPDFVSAAFGLARCKVAQGDRKGAVAALESVPHTSGLYVRSRVAAARLLIHRRPTLPEVPDLTAASAVTEALVLQGMDHLMLSTQILSATLDLVTSKAIQRNEAIRILGHPLDETELRRGLEKSLRAMAHLSDGDERIELVDRANQVRPRTIV